MKAQFLTPSITVFDAEGNLDAAGNRAVYEHLIAGGVDGIVVMGSTGEFPAMSMDMQKELIDIAVECIKGRTRLLVGTSRMIAAETAELSTYAHTRGVDGVMIVGPYYFSSTDESVEAYFDAVASNTEADIYLYNYPDRTGYAISADVTLRLVRKHRNIVGFKDTITDMGHTCELIRKVKGEFPDFVIYSGFDNNFIHNLMSGGNGCIGGLSNLAPEIFAAWVKAWNDGDFTAMCEIQKRVDELMELYTVSTPFIPAMKKAMQLRGMRISDKCLLPLLSLGDEGARKLEAIMKRARLV